jgi:hypothetical protein
MISQGVKSNLKSSLENLQKEINQMKNKRTMMMVDAQISAAKEVDPCC